MADVKITTTLDGVNQVKAGFDSMSGAVKTAAAAMATALAGIGITKLIKDVIDSGDEIQKLSQKLGASTESLSQYKHVAGLAGVSLQQLSMGWQYMSRSISEASTGTGTAVNALDELGLSAKRLKTLAPEQQFEVIADALDGVKNASDKTRIASDLFGARQTALLQVIEGGSAALRAGREEANSYGLTLSRVDADNMADFNDGMERMKNAGLGLVNMFVVQMGPALEAIGEFIGKVIPAATQFFVDAINGMRIFGLKAFEAILNGIEWVYEKLSLLPGSVGEFYKELKDKFEASSNIVNELADSYTMATMEVKDFTVKQGVAMEEIKLATGETNKLKNAVDDKGEADKEAAKKAEEYKAAMVLVREAEEENNRAKDRAIQAYKEMLEPMGMTIDAHGEIVDIVRKETPIIHDNETALAQLNDEYSSGARQVQDWGKIFNQTHHTVYDVVSSVVWDIKGAWHGFFGAVIAEGGSFKSAVSALWGDIKTIILRKLAEIVADALWNQLANLITGKTSALTSLGNYASSVLSRITQAGNAASAIPSVPGVTGGAAGGAGGAAVGVGAAVAGAAVLGIGVAAINGIINRGTGTINPMHAQIAVRPSGYQFSGHGVGDFNNEMLNAALGQIGDLRGPTDFMAAVAAAVGQNSDEYRAAERAMNFRVNGLATDEVVRNARSSMRSRAEGWLESNRSSFDRFGNKIISDDEYTNLSRMISRGFATGGQAVFSRPTLISVAEAGPEMIHAKPLASGGASGGGGSVFNGPVFFDELSLSRFHRGMMAGLERAEARF